MNLISRIKFAFRIIFNFPYNVEYWFRKDNSVYVDGKQVWLGDGKWHHIGIVKMGEK